MENYNLEITADERFMLIVALATTLAGGLRVDAPPVKDFSALARRLLELQPSSSIQPAAPKTTSPAVAPTRAPAPVAQTRGKDAGADTREFPSTMEEMVNIGYMFTGTARCNRCKQQIEWWLTPNKKKMPMDFHSIGPYRSHFATCPNADEFRK